MKTILKENQCPLQPPVIYMNWVRAESEGRELDITGERRGEK